MLYCKKGEDRVFGDFSDNNLLDRMELTHSRICIRYRAIMAIIKDHGKLTWDTGSVMIRSSKTKNILMSVGD